MYVLSVRKTKCLIVIIIRRLLYVPVRDLEIFETYNRKEKK